MARRSRAELLAEHDRLRSCLDALAAALGPVLEPAIPGYLTAGLIPADDMRAAVERGEASASEVMAGAREALNDLTGAVADLQRRAPEQAQQVLEDYRRRTGRDLWSDAGHPKRMLAAILRRGRLRDETEARLVTEYLADTSQILLTAAQIDKANRMMAEFQRCGL